MNFGSKSIFAPTLLIFALAIVTPAEIKHAQAQSETKKSSVEYVQNAIDLLKQASIEYKNGNYAKAEEIAGSAYLDNIEYVEPELQRRNQSGLVTELEKMMAVDLRGMIKDRVPQDQLDAEISAIDAKLTQVITIVPEFPIGMISMLMVIVIGVFAAITKIKENTRSPNT